MYQLRLCLASPRCHALVVDVKLGPQLRCQVLVHARKRLESSFAIPAESALQHWSSTQVVHSVAAMF